MNQNIANIFKSCRKFNRLQQTEMARTLNVTQGTISKVEAASMGIELELWFKFLEVFKVKDPYCFYYNSFEINGLNHNSFIREGSSLIPSFKFDESFLYFEVRFIRPLIDIVQIMHPNEFESFIKKYKIKNEIFYILNHPLPLEVIDLFFNFLESIKINAKTLILINLDFQTALGETFEKGKNPELTDILDIFNRGNNYLNYKIINQNEYIVTAINSNLSSFKQVNLFSEYCLLLPFLFLKSKNNSNIKLQNKEFNNKNKWTICYS